MVRFSCFSTPSLYQKPKKVRHLSDKMHSNLLQKSKDRERKVDFGSPSTNPNSINVEEATTPSSRGDNSKSEYSNGDFHLENNKEFSQTAGIKKGQSLGNILDNERAFSDDEVDTQNKEPISRNISFNFDNQNKEFVSGESLATHHARCNSLFSIEVLEQFDGNLHSLNEGTVEFHENYDVNSPEKVASNSYNSPQESDEDRKDQEHILNQNYDELNPAEFNVRRIVDWINQIDIENSSGVVGEIGECSCSFSSPERQVEVSVPPIKPDVRSSLGMEMAHNFISSLTATSSSAQMINLGLVFVPVLSAFSGLRVLNLSGNFIVPISAGSLPKGLHMLNLSKNNITTIEGLRDLTRLRVLDLSYNRIVRIGHGLASCSSLKELYLAGNKISEIEGLHRLLKLNILDLRANKISTAKGLGQLAANYASLQSINLQGNPCRENVRDKQLKKYLLTLLPNLIYYNKQGIKTSGTKEIFSRTEHKTPRRGSHGSGLQKLASTHVRSSHATGSRSRNVNLSLMAYQKKAVSLQENSPIRKNRSQSTL